LSSLVSTPDNWFNFILIAIYLDFNDLNKDVALSNNLEWWTNDKVIEFYQAIKALTGLIFLVLGITILNYGTKLETAISNSAQQPLSTVGSRKASSLSVGST
jgi:hypothetical protein